MKHEWRKKESSIYLPKNSPQEILIPKFNYFLLDGKGNPNNKEFKQAVEVLYSLAYAVKMLPKKNIIPDGYYDYTVYPLEGIWDLTLEAKIYDILDKDSLIYTLMIRQPDFLTDELTKEIINDLKKKKPHPLLDNIRYDSLAEGLCVQMLHIGPYDDEPKTFKLMEDYCIKNNLKRLSKVHKEIYLSDARKVEPQDLKTVLRFRVEKI